MTTLVGVGLKIEGEKSDGIVEIEELTIKGADESGLFAYKGMNVIMRGISVEDSQFSGVYAYEADISCDDLQVVGCGNSGVIALTNATITLSGQGTSITGNVTSGGSSYYGLEARTRRNSNIQLVLPLTKEEASTNNGGGGNWGAYGTIEQVSK